VKFGGRSILLWGPIKEDGSRILLRCPPILISATYQSVLHEWHIFQRFHTDAWRRTISSITLDTIILGKKENLLYMHLASTVTRFKYYWEHLVTTKEKCYQDVPRYNWRVMDGCERIVVSNQGCLHQKFVYLYTATTGRRH